MPHTITLIISSALIFSAPSLAAEPDAQLAPVHSLSQAEVDRILDAAAAKREAVVPQGREIEGEPPRPQIHGEVGFGIGTGGYRSAFGSAVVPLDDGFAAFSFGRTDFGVRDVQVYDRPYNR